MKKNLRDAIFVRYGLEYRQFSAGLDFTSSPGSSSYAFDLDYQASFISAIVGIEDGIWVSEKFSLSAQFAVIPSYQVANEVSGEQQRSHGTNQDFGAIADFHLGLRPGLLFHYRLGPGFSLLAEAAYTFHPTTFLAGRNPYVMSHHFGFGVGLAADLEHFIRD